MEQDEDTSSPMSPFWVPKKNNHRLRRSYSLLLTSTSLIVFLLAFALVFVLIVVPTLRSFTSTIFKPQTLKLKKSWDSLNLILVLFAVVCGFLTKNDTNETQTPRFDNNNRNSNSNSNSNYYSYHHQRSFSNPVTPPSWYENSNSNRSFNPLRTVGSYPDLRQQPPWNTDDERCRFYDDTHPILRHRYSVLEPEEVVVENSRTVTFGEVSDSPVRLPEMKPLTETVRRNAERAYETETIEKPEIDDFAAEISTSPPRKPSHSVRKKKGEIATNENTETIISSEFSVTPVVQPDPEPKPPQKPPQKPPHSVRKKKREIASKENTETITSSEFSVTPVVQPVPEPQPPPPTRTKPVRRNVKRTYQVETIEKPENSDYFGESSQPPSPPPLPAVIKSDLHGKKKRGSVTKEFLISLRRKKKKQRQRSVENFESLLNSQLAKQSQPPPPPPPPASVFHNLLSFNKSKNKTHYLVPVETYNPRLPNKREQTYKEKVVMTGNESPLIPIPPPPPPPPFKLPDWRFRVQGDYVRVDSIGSSRSGSPDSDGVVESETSQCNSPFAPSGEGSGSGNGNAASLFCPSPDVDTKAHNFIENFRAGLRMAKMNSIKEKQGIGRSNLGPLPKP